MLAAVRDAARGGAAVLLVAHRPGAVAEADRTVEVGWAADAEGRGVTRESLCDPAHRAAGPLAAPARRPGGCRGRWGGDRARGHVGLADQPRGGAAGDADAAGGDHGRARVRHQPRRLPLRSSGWRPTTPRSGSWASCAGPSTRGSRRWRPPGWQSCAPATCWHDSWATWTGWRTCGSGSCCPYASAAVVAVGTVAFVAWMVPAAGIVLAVSLLVTAIVAPIAAGGVSRRAEARLAPGRGELADAALDLLRGAPEIMVAGAAPLAIAERPSGRRAPRRRRATIRRGRGRRAGSSPPSRRASRCGPPWCSGSSRCARAASAAWPSPWWR